MNNLLSVLLSTLKARITPIWTKLKYWTSWNFIRSKILTRIRVALTSIFQVKPRDKNDYYSVLGYLVSRRLARAVVVVMGILCLCYFLWVKPIANMADSMHTGDKVYSYNSFFLRFTEGPVKIKAKSGYVAYDGNVEKGYVTGQGRLFDETGGLVYTGNFENIEYSGQGTLYYPIGQIKYEGEFQKNAFNGAGTLYRENGTKQYEGAFAEGVYEGEGTLYNPSEVAVFHGNFHHGELLYAQLLQKTPSEIAEYYTGTMLLYQKDTESVVFLEDIDAFYATTTEHNSMESEDKVGSIYVGKKEFVYGDRKMTSIQEICEVLGQPVFEGNSYVTFPEAVGIRVLKEKGMEIPVEIQMETSQIFDEVSTVDSYTEDALVYLYVFEADDITYTFFTADRAGDFFLYQLEQ